MIELEEILLTEEEKQKIEEKKDKKRADARAALKSAIKAATAALAGPEHKQDAQDDASSEVTAAPSKQQSGTASTLDAEQEKQLDREEQLREVQSKLAKLLAEAEYTFSDRKHDCISKLADSSASD